MNKDISLHDKDVYNDQNELIGDFNEQSINGVELNESNDDSLIDQRVKIVDYKSYNWNEKEKHDTNRVTNGNDNCDKHLFMDINQVNKDINDSGGNFEQMNVKIEKYKMQREDKNEDKNEHENEDKNEHENEDKNEHENEDKNEYREKNQDNSNLDNYTELNQEDNNNELLLLTSQSHSLNKIKNTHAYTGTNIDFENVSITHGDNINNDKNTTNSSNNNEIEILNENIEIPNVFPAPCIEIELYVGKIPRSFEDSEIIDLFSLFGNVISISSLKDKSNGLYRPAVLLTLESISQADLIIRYFDKRCIYKGNKLNLKVQYSSGEIDRLGLRSELCMPGVDQIKLFIGALPRNINEQYIFDIFSPYGKINEIFIMREPNNGNCKGCAFIKYEYKEQGLFAIMNLNGLVYLPQVNRPLEVKIASKISNNTNNYNFIVNKVHYLNHMNKNLIDDYSIYNDQLLNLYYNSPHNLSNNNVINNCNNNCNINNNRLIKNNLNYSNQPINSLSQNSVTAAVISANLMPRCIGSWKEYFTVEGKPYYYNDITRTSQWEVPNEFMNINTNTNTNNIHNNNLSGNINKDVVGPPGANIFIFNVPYEWNKQYLINHFCMFGNILSAHLMIDKNSGRNKGVAFVSYDNVKSAASAVSNMNGFITEHGRKLKVSIKQGQEQFVQHLFKNN